jgi:hypothetical protein
MNASTRLPSAVKQTLICATWPLARRSIGAFLPNSPEAIVVPSATFRTVIKPSLSAEARRVLSGLKARSLAAQGNDHDALPV